MSDSEMDRSDTDEDVTGVVVRLVKGCEDFVTQRLIDFENKMNENCSKILAEGQARVEEKLKTSDDRMMTRFNDIGEMVNAKDTEIDSQKNEIKTLKREMKELKSANDKKIEDCVRKLKTLAELENKVQEQETEIERQTREIQNLNHELKQSKDKEPCRCQDLYEAYVTAGKVVFSDRKLVLIDSPLNTSETEMLNVDVSTPLVCGTATFPSTAPIDSGRVVAERISSDSTPRVIVERLSTPAVFQDASFSGTTGCSIAAPMEISPTAIEEGMASIQPSVCSRLFGVQGLETSPIYTDIEELPEEMRNKVNQYFEKRSTQATKEKLSDLQRAYIRWFLASEEMKGISLGASARQLLDKGVSDRIWTSTYCPAGCADFHKYLKQRIKNERAQMKISGLKRLAETQQERLNKIVKK